MIDLLIPSQTSGERLVDHYGKAEILFFGPDGTRQILSENLDEIRLSIGRGNSRYDGLGCTYELSVVFKHRILIILY